jgi:hypothetical protein
MEAIHSSETSVYTRSTRLHSPKTAFTNIKIDLREMGWGGMDWIHLAEDRDQ